MREDWQQEQYQMPNDKALSLSLSLSLPLDHEEEAATVLCAVVSLQQHLAIPSFEIDSFVVFSTVVPKNPNQSKYPFAQVCSCQVASEYTSFTHDNRLNMKGLCDVAKSQVHVDTTTDH